MRPNLAMKFLRIQTLLLNSESWKVERFVNCSKHIHWKTSQQGKETDVFKH